jgi:hypothetical protein
MIVKPLWTVTEDEDSGGGDADEVEDDADQGADDGDDGDEESASGKEATALQREREKVKELRRTLKEEREKAQERDEKKGDGEDFEKKAEAKWKPRVVNSTARAAFLEAGGTNVSALLKLLDHDELAVSDDGTVDGLDDEVERLRDECPELFKPRRGAGRIETGDRSGRGGAKRELTASERQARQIIGKS